ncbi:GNAT family N-acetyltransferase [Candidatus Roizmanbacteria bacterium]|nr:GNAT family N-acetyltransferase [Candidatus Roizmanbacteria bacterium]
MDTIQILQAKDVSVEDYRRLRLEALREEPQAFGSTHSDQINLPIEEWQKWLDKYVEEKNNWMVFAAVDTQLAGMVGAYQTDEMIENQSVQIIAMYVPQPARGKGVSKLLMRTLLEKLKKAGIKEAVLDVNVDQTTAVNLYKSFGFTIVDTVTLTLGDGKEHQVHLMKKVW